MHAELKETLVSKEELVTNLLNLVYHQTYEVEHQAKLLHDTDQQHI